MWRRVLPATRRVLQSLRGSSPLSCAVPSRSLGCAAVAAAAVSWACCEDNSKPVQRIVVLVAMKEEAAPFLAKHNMQPMLEPPWPSSMPMRAYTGQVNGCELILVWAGTDTRYAVNNVGTTASAVSAYASIIGFKPDIIISAGTAGGFRSSGGQIADVYISTKCVFHARRIPAVGLYEEYGYGHYRSPPLGRLVAKLSLKQGVVSTSDSLDCSPVDLELMASEGAAVKEMEAASIAWVCLQASVPFVAVKSITDIVRPR
eukprot:TRINITY_DN20964_c0_g1_i1.p1 TRINITY_DN20964_c0_g1~~TRINITY_DN20964_c0_g1_i1.p1  ORF type:complete len:259 (-),score=40.90 TRINITY_DN20964_c0_g1_i1:259-1035(-)